jgi:ribosomal protein S18 acetylase RimI-like enzyme
MSARIMQARTPPESGPNVRLRAGAVADIDALLALEIRVFATDRCSRRSFRRFLSSDLASVIIAESGGQFAGYALVLFRPNSAVARLYSIAVAPEQAGKRVGSALVAAAEENARAHGCMTLRLEVHVGNVAAIRLYDKAGYRLFGRHAGYYGDGGDALRYEKPLRPQPF